MRFYRYMSWDEFWLMLSGKRMVNNRDHSAHAPSQSVGFCFIAEKTEVVEHLEAGNIERVLTPEKMYHNYLVGVVTDDVLVEFETTPAIFDRTRASYAAQFGSWSEKAVITEFCTPLYDTVFLHPLRYQRFSTDDTGYRAMTGFWHSIKSAEAVLARRA